MEKKIDNDFSLTPVSKEGRRGLISMMAIMLGFTFYTGTMLTDCDEGELAWIDKKALLALPLWEGDKLFLRLLDEGAPFFSLKLVYEGERLVSSSLNVTGK